MLTTRTIFFVEGFTEVGTTGGGAGVASIWIPLRSFVSTQRPTFDLQYIRYCEPAYVLLYLRAASQMLCYSTELMRGEAPFRS